MSPTAPPIDSADAFAFTPLALTPAQPPATVAALDASARAERPNLPPAPDTMTTANTARERARRRLDELVWQFPDGTRRVPLLTSSRWMLYESLRGRIGGDQSAIVVDSETATHEAYSRRFLDAGILLYLCLHPAHTWQQPRQISDGTRTVEDVPLLADFSSFLRAISEWADSAIPVDRLGAAVALAEELASLTFSAIAVSRTTADDAPGDDSEQKKTPFLTSSPPISPSSAPL